MHTGLEAALTLYESAQQNVHLLSNNNIPGPFNKYEGDDVPADLETLIQSMHMNVEDTHHFVEDLQSIYAVVQDTSNLKILMGILTTLELSDHDRSKRSLSTDGADISSWLSSG